MGLSGTYDEELISLSLSVIHPLPPCETPLARLERGELFLLGPTARSGRFEQEDLAPDGGVLVGLRVTTGERWGGVISSIQPIYQLEDRYHLGKTMGNRGDSIHDLLARPGYALGGVKIKSSLVHNAIQGVFYRVLEGGQLDPTQDYHSGWIGINSGENLSVMSDGAPLVGARVWFEADIEAIGLINTESAR